MKNKTRRTIFGKEIKVVIFRSWWAFWRRPFLGINPFGWHTVSEVTAEDGSIIMADGCWKPNDGGGGNYTFEKNIKGSVD